jgi:hypothetical protein
MFWFHSESPWAGDGSVMEDAGVPLEIVKSSTMRAESCLWEAKFCHHSLLKIGNAQSSLPVQNNWTTSGFTLSVLHIKSEWKLQGHSRIKIEGNWTGKRWLSKT